MQGIIQCNANKNNPHFHFGDWLEDCAWAMTFWWLGSVWQHFGQWLIWWWEPVSQLAWWHCQMETFPAFLALCAGNSPVTGEFPSQRPVTRSIDVFFDLSLNKRLSKQSGHYRFETSWRSLWRHCEETARFKGPNLLITQSGPYIGLVNHAIWDYAMQTISLDRNNTRNLIQTNLLCVAIFHRRNNYRKVSNIRRTKSQNLNASRLIL